MLIKVVPYYPDLKRSAQRMNHHQYVALNISYVKPEQLLGFDWEVKRYGK
jgi:hypothetical protein